MSDILKNKRCVPCGNGASTLDENKINEYPKLLPDWEVKKVYINDTEINTLNGNFRFKNYVETISFLNKVADLAESERHHPDFCVKYKVVEFSLWTHTVKGLHENDFILASKINMIAESCMESVSDR